MSDANIMNIIGDGVLFEIIEKRGFVIFINPERCFNYGARNQETERIQLIISYAPPNEPAEGGTALYTKNTGKSLMLAH